MSKLTKAEHLQRELYDVLFEKRIAGDHKLSDAEMSYVARQIADYLTDKYVLKRRRRKR